jgi:biotin carboxyl carrier protein
MAKTKPMQYQGKAPELKKFELRGDIYYTTFTVRFENRRKWSKPDEKKVLSFIPGTIRDIYVKEGDVIKSSEKLLVLEAMKMMNTIYSPADGRIKYVAVKEGDRVPKGAVMVEFE